MIQRILAIRSLAPLPFLKPAWTSGSSRFTYSKVLLLTKNKATSTKCFNCYKRYTITWLCGYYSHWKAKASHSVMSNSCDPMDCSSLGSSVHGFSKQEFWSWLPFPSSGDLPNPGIKPRSPELQAEPYRLNHQGSRHSNIFWIKEKTLRYLKSRNDLQRYCPAGTMYWKYSQYFRLLVFR